MVDFEDPKSFENWLDAQPQEVCTTIAARSALRVVPLLVPESKIGDAKYRTAVLLPCLRAVVASWVAAVCPVQRGETRAAAAAAATAPSTIAAAAAAPAVTTPDLMATTSAYAAVARTATASAPSATFVARASASAIAYTTYDSADINSAFRSAFLFTAADAALVHDGEIASTLSERPLWPEDAPSPGCLTNSWRDLKADLLNAADEGWEVWIQWYEDRLAGRPSNQDLEVAKVLIPDEIWEQGPKVLNAEIARLIEEHKPKQAAERPISDLLAMGALRLSLAEWSLDRVADMMVLEPFADDYRDAMDDATQRMLQAALNDLRTIAGFVTEDISGERINSQAAGKVVTNLIRYVEQLGTAGRPNPGTLITLGKWLQDDWANEAVGQSLGETLHSRLGDVVAKHADLMRLFLSGALARLQTTSPLKLPSRLSPDELVALVLSLVDAMEDEGWEKPASEPDRAVMRNIADHIVGLNAERDLSMDPRHQEKLTGQIEEESRILVATAGRYAVRTAEVSRQGLATLSDAKTLWPEKFAALMEKFSIF